MKIHLESSTKVYNLLLYRYLDPDPLFNFRCSFSFRHKNTPLDNHIQRGKTVQLFYKRYDFISNPQCFIIKINPTPPSHFSQGYVVYPHHTRGEGLRSKRSAVMGQQMQVVQVLGVQLEGRNGRLRLLGLLVR